ncbi:hypothetical protein BC936DRAFT_149573 [Jimgerdemannia flammicorona]|uniref:USP domain-containing protein n=1 Tax=Jimgerdemannia flammicorona TaxID=994334 RepID=A0A433D0K3_9FUNG|nr:hypothetical protein BC936DRAFT_149573 [Jimgerdemannia flammicorona]
MNSLLQSLYCTNHFRRAVYEIPTETDEPTKSVALALQRVFYNLQFQETPVGTTELTKSFGWDSLDAFMQHDVQEFNRVLQDNLEAKMKNTPADGAIKRLFVGRMKSYIKCINVDFESSRVEDYYDIQLNVKGCKNLYESFKDYVSEETLEGDNKYMAEGHGLQDAKKGVIFESFPPVLHLQLKRFEYDIQRDAMVKVGWNYRRHGVLVHSGDLHGGHYFALLKPDRNGKWLKYDDDRVTPVTDREVLEDNYGGEPPNANALMALRPHMKAMKRFTNAYMLVYIRESDIDDVLAPMTNEDIPMHLSAYRGLVLKHLLRTGCFERLTIERRLDEERALQEQRKREHKEMHLYITVKIVTDETFKAHQGFDLASFDDKTAQSEIPSFRVRKEETFADFKQSVSDHFQIPTERFRLWILVNRQNRTVRPDQPIPETDANTSMDNIREKLASNFNILRLYLEVAEKPVSGKLWPTEGANVYLMIFIKYFDPKLQIVEWVERVFIANVPGCGKLYVSRNGKVGDIVPILNEKKGFPQGTQLKLFEEIKPSMIEAMKTKATFQQSEIQDGDIICFQKEISDKEYVK